MVKLLWTKVVPGSVPLCTLAKPGMTIPGPVGTSWNSGTKILERQDPVRVRKAV